PLSSVVFAGLTRKLNWSMSLFHWKSILLAGVFSSLSWYTYTFALSHTSVANAVFLLYTAPCYVIVLSPLLLKVKAEKKSVVALILSLAGMTAIMKDSGLSIGELQVGDLLALSSGIFYALTILSLKRLPPEILGITANVYMSFVITITSIPQFFRYYHYINTSNIIVLILLGIVQQGIATSLYYSGLGKIKAHEASILAYLEPLSSVVFAFLFLQESLTVFSVLGGVLILLGGLIVLKKTKREF
ncbi:MAG: DMT family transporter, partial [Firmicutes bacterium]|nr:DMT family transporter [Bacillota bacterium]